MTLTPNRRHNSNDASAVPAANESAEPVGPTYRDLLNEAGFDLTDHPLADRFDTVADLSDDLAEDLHDCADSGPDSDSDADAAIAEGAKDVCADDSPAGGQQRDTGLRGVDLNEPASRSEIDQAVAELDAEQDEWRQKKSEEARARRDAADAEFLERNPERRAEMERDDAEWRRNIKAYELRQEEAAQAERDKAERHRTALENLTSSSDAHPLLDEYRWSDLKHVAPELTDSIDSLHDLLDELYSFSRPMGSDDAVAVMDGLETLGRLQESLSVVTLSVFERVGTPRDFGAKSTRALVQNRLNLTSQEARRRTELAENLGKQVTVSGQSIEPKFALVAVALRNGTLSANQANTIVRCLNKIPSCVGEEEVLKAEEILVDKAPAVRVRDIYELFKEILGWIDPDGAQPEESVDREDCNVNLRQMSDGTWVLKGRLDAESGGILNGLLTSRIKTEEEKADRAAKTGSCADADQVVVDAFSEVLRGDRSDCVDPSLDLTASLDTQSGEVPAGVGVREDGAMVPMADKQPSVRRRIYERFSSLIGSIEMNRIKAGAAYALVVTAKAEDIANRTGRAATGTEAPFPIRSAALEGLNGSVFFHLMGEKAKTMELATERRFATEKQLAILTSRDQGCTFPGCDTPPGWCEAHHAVSWAEGGVTDVNNLTLACGVHNRLVEKSDWYTVILGDGRPAWVPPASVDPARRPVLHARFIAREIGETLFG